jgi:hypothetical protein
VLNDLAEQLKDLWGHHIKDASVHRVLDRARALYDKRDEIPNNMVVTRMPVVLGAVERRA